MEKATELQIADAVIRNQKIYWSKEHWLTLFFAKTKVLQHFGLRSTL